MVLGKARQCLETQTAMEKAWETAALQVQVPMDPKVRDQLVLMELSQMHGKGVSAVMQVKSMQQMLSRSMPRLQFQTPKLQTIS